MRASNVFNINSVHLLLLIICFINSIKCARKACQKEVIELEEMLVDLSKELDECKSHLEQVEALVLDENEDKERCMERAAHLQTALKDKEQQLSKNNKKYKQDMEKMEEMIIQMDNAKVECRAKLRDITKDKNSKEALIWSESECKSKLHNITLRFKSAEDEIKAIKNNVTSMLLNQSVEFNRKLNDLEMREQELIHRLDHSETVCTDRIMAKEALLLERNRELEDLIEDMGRQTDQTEACSRDLQERERQLQENNNRLQALVLEMGSAIFIQKKDNIDTHSSSNTNWTQIGGVLLVILLILFGYWSQRCLHEKLRQQDNMLFIERKLGRRYQEENEKLSITVASYEDKIKNLTSTRETLQKELNRLNFLREENKVLQERLMSKTHESINRSTSPIPFQEQTNGAELEYKDAIHRLANIAEDSLKLQMEKDSINSALSDRDLSFLLELMGGRRAQDGCTEATSDEDIRSITKRKKKEIENLSSGEEESRISSNREDLNTHSSPSTRECNSSPTYAQEMILTAGEEDLSEYHIEDPLPVLAPRLHTRATGLNDSGNETDTSIADSSRYSHLTESEDSEGGALRVAPIHSKQRYANNDLGVNFEFPEIGVSWIHSHIVQGDSMYIEHFLPMDVQLANNLHLLLTWEELPLSTGLGEYTYNCVQRVMSEVGNSVEVLQHSHIIMPNSEGYLIRYLQWYPAPMLSNFLIAVGPNRKVFTWQMVWVGPSIECVSSRYSYLDNLYHQLLDSIVFINP